MFPTPVYVIKRDSNLTSGEEKEIEEIIKSGMHLNYDPPNSGNSSSNNSHIFDSPYFSVNGNLEKIKQFCEQQLKIYVEELIIPREEIEIYITQSWLNVNKPGEFHHQHSHSNSILSGVFYISTEEGDSITFTDPNFDLKHVLRIEPEKFNVWNSSICSSPSITNELILFPSWLIHQVEPNEKATTDRISISFNTFVKGTLGSRDGLTELIL
jgi:uncharacterized protein (TIGR02466 family)